MSLRIVFHFLQISALLLPYEGVERCTHLGNCHTCGRACVAVQKIWVGDLGRAEVVIVLVATAAAAPDSIQFGLRASSRWPREPGERTGWQAIWCSRLLADADAVSVCSSGLVWLAD